MADQSVDILITIRQQGQETLKAIDNDLAKLGKTQDTNTKSTTLHSSALDKLNTGLVKEYPNLKSLVPLMGALGLSTLLTGGILTGLALTTMSLSQNYMTLTTSIAMLGITAATSGVNLGGWTLTQKEAQKMADALGISLGEATAALTKLIPVTRDAGAAEDLLQKAVAGHRDTGKDLNSIIQSYIDVLKLGGFVIDEHTGKILTGGDAVRGCLGCILMAIYYGYPLGYRSTNKPDNYYI